MTDASDRQQLKVTSMTAGEAARILSAALGRQVTATQVEAVIEAGHLAGPGERFSLIEYAAFLAGEVTGGH